MKNVFLVLYSGRGSDSTKCVLQIDLHILNHSWAQPALYSFLQPFICLPTSSYFFTARILRLNVRKSLMERSIAVQVPEQEHEWRKNTANDADDEDRREGGKEEVRRGRLTGD